MPARRDSVLPSSPGRTTGDRPCAPAGIFPAGFGKIRKNGRIICYNCLLGESGEEMIMSEELIKNAKKPIDEMIRLG